MTRDTVTAAHGRWREILPALGIQTALLNGKHQPCPMCGGVDRFRFDDRKRGGEYYCSQCGPGMGMKLLMRVKGWDFPSAAKEVDKIIGNLPPKPNGPEFYTARATSPAACRRLYATSYAVTDGDPVSLYLAKRNLAMPHWPKALRYVPAMRHGYDHTDYPGMLAVVSDPDGHPVTIHRTYLTTSGEKATIKPNRMFMPGKLSEGGAIRLLEPAHTMGIAEGIENALAASRLFNLPVWAAATEGMLQKWMPPLETRCIAIYGDADVNYVGQTAAYILAKRLMGLNRKLDVHVILPPHGKDWNEVLLEERSKDVAA